MNWTSLTTKRRTLGPHWSWVSIVAGCVLIALGFRLFMNPNQIVAGGVVGLSTILERSLGWEPAVVQWAINVPLLLLAFRSLGRGAGLRSVIGSMVLPLCILLSKNLPPITTNTLLASVFGGLVYGAGLGLVLSGGGSVGGYSLLARMFTKLVPVPISAVISTLDALTLLGGMFQFGAERTMFGLIAIFMMRRALDTILLGFSRAKVALIISTEHERIRESVLRELGRGLTVLPATGGFTEQARPVLMVVLGQTTVPALRAKIRELDPEAFVVLMDAAEVLGQGFQRPA